MRCIIPAAGFGTRMNMKTDQSKEMLLDNTGNSIIRYCLDLCWNYKLNPLIVTRKEKTDLIEYCNDLHVETLIIETKGEWPETVLASQEYWEESNILILPDTRFNSTEVIQYMKNDLELHQNYSIAIHKINPEESSKWCVTNGVELIEKPNHIKFNWAMGLIAWNKLNGEELFNSLSIKGNIHVLENTGFHYLDSFKDITRNGIIE